MSLETVAALFALPIAALCLLTVATFKWPRLYWRFAMIMVFGLLMPAVVFWQLALFSGDSATWATAILASVPAVVAGVGGAFATAYDMQSRSRAVLYSSVKAGSLGKVAETPTRWTRGSRNKQAWDRYAVPKGMPRKAHEVRRKAVGATVLLAIAGVLAWGLMLAVRASLATWAMLALVLVIPTCVMIRARRVRFAGAVARDGGLATAQVIDPVRPEYVSVNLGQGVLIRREPEVDWVVSATNHPHGLWLVVGVAPDSIPSVRLELMSDCQWRSVVWFGNTPWAKSISATEATSASSQQRLSDGERRSSRKEAQR